MKALIAAAIFTSAIATATLSASANYFGTDPVTKQGQNLDGTIFGPIEKKGI